MTKILFVCHGNMNTHLASSVERGKEHSVSAVIVKQGRVDMCPRAANIIRNSAYNHVVMIGDRRPGKKYAPVAQTVYKRRVRAVSVKPLTVIFRMRRSLRRIGHLARFKQNKRLSHALLEIGSQLGGAYLSDVRVKLLNVVIGPVARVNHIRRAVIHTQRAVDTALTLGSRRMIGYRDKHSVGSIAYRYFGAAKSILSEDREEQIIFAIIIMNLGSPKLLTLPSGRIELVHVGRLAPFFKIRASVNYYRRAVGRACRAIHIVNSVRRDDIRISYSYIFSFDHNQSHSAL